MHNSKITLQSNSSNIINISSYQKRNQQPCMEQLQEKMLEVEPAVEVYGNSEIMRVILAFDQMNQNQAQEFYRRLSEQISTRSKKLLRKCLEELLCFNSSLLPQIEEMATGILLEGKARQ